MRRITFYVDESLLDELDPYVQAIDMTRSEYLRAMLEAHLTQARRFTPEQFSRFGQWRVSQLMEEIFRGPSD